MIKNIILDVNDVLVTRDIKHTNKVLADEYNLPIFLPGNRDLFEKLKVNKIKLPEFLEKCSERYGKTPKEISEIIIKLIVAHAKLHTKLITFLKSKKTENNIAILSHSNPLRNVADKQCGLFDITPNRFFSDETGYRKTEVHAFKHLLSKMNWIPEECVFIDDKKAHTDVAESLGIKTIVFTSEDKTIKELITLFSE